MSINSRSKGKRGELEFAKLLSGGGYPARRGRQFRGTSDSPDVICETLSHFHFEVKRREAGNPYQWMQQAQAECGEKIPIVVHRRNGKPWLVIMTLDDFLRRGE
ncbi:MAG: hypothetical protein KGL39_12295 [Patescibacteria group bacterium]|nr:hypothetical protein [Patescibacteria group bacterium]